MATFINRHIAQGLFAGVVDRIRSAGTVDFETLAPHEFGIVEGLAYAKTFNPATFLRWTQFHDFVRLGADGQCFVAVYDAPRTGPVAGQPLPLVTDDEFAPLNLFTDNNHAFELIERARWACGISSEIGDDEEIRFSAAVGKSTFASPDRGYGFDCAEVVARAAVLEFVRTCPPDFWTDTKPTYEEKTAPLAGDHHMLQVENDLFAPVAGEGDYLKIAPIRFVGQQLVAAMVDGREVLGFTDAHDFRSGTDEEFCLLVGPVYGARLSVKPSDVTGVVVGRTRHFGGRGSDGDRSIHEWPRGVFLREWKEARDGGVRRLA